MLKNLAKKHIMEYNYYAIVCEKGGRSMDITDVRVRKFSDEGKMKAIVSITFDDEFVVHDVKIIEGQNGLFVAMPSRKMGEGDFRDIAHPLLSETRTRIKDAVFAEYERLLQEDAVHS
jgi:stage V sporulation protein G